MITALFLQDTHFALQQNDLVRECPETPGGITTNEKAHPVNPGALKKLY